MQSLTIAAENLRKSYGATPGLADFTAHFKPGLLHGIIGPDGAGKTTFFRTAAGLLKAQGGSISYLLEGRKTPLSRARPFLSYMPSAPSLYPDLSVEEHLKFFGDLFGMEKEDYANSSAKLLRLTRLEDFRDRPAGKLSGGMYKKLGLACALLRKPALLLLDEPTNGVDPVSRRELWDMLYALRAKGTTILTATAYMDEAERCDEVVLLDRGRLLLQGEPGELLAKRGAASFDELFMGKI